MRHEELRCVTKKPTRSTLKYWVLPYCILSTSIVILFFDKWKRFKNTFSSCPNFFFSFCVCVCGGGGGPEDFPNSSTPYAMALEIRCKPTVESIKITSTMFLSRKYSTNMANIFTWITYSRHGLYSESLDSKVFSSSPYFLTVGYGTSSYKLSFNGQLVLRNICLACFKESSRESLKPGEKTKNHTFANQACAVIDIKKSLFSSPILNC